MTTTHQSSYGVYIKAGSSSGLIASIFFKDTRKQAFYIFFYSHNVYPHLKY